MSVSERMGRAALRMGVASAALLAAGPACAGAWMQDPGRTLLIFAGTWSGSTRGFSAAGRAAPAARLENKELSAYAEVGVWDGWTALAQTTLQDKSLGSAPAAAYRGFDYTELGVRRRLWAEGPFVVSLQGSLRLPGAHGGATNPATAGNTGPEVDTRVIAGAAFTLFGYDGFGDLALGYRTRGGAPPDEGRADIALGIRARSDVLVLPQSFNKFANGKGSAGFTSYREHKLQSSVVWDFTPAWSLQVGALTTIAGRNTPQELGGLVAVWRRF